MKTLWNAAPTSATASLLVTKFEKLRPADRHPRRKVAILRSFTLEPVVPSLRALAFLGGIDLDVRLGEFNSIAQEVIDKNSWVYQWQPDVVIVAAQARDLAPRLWDEFTDLTAEEAAADATALGDTVGQWIDLLRASTKAHIIIHNFQLPQPAGGIADVQSSRGQMELIRSANQAIAHAARKHKNVYVLDYDGLVAKHGSARWEDVKKWLTVRLPIAADQFVHLAREWMRFMHPIAGKVCKCLVTDLDNTLWGGVIGEDGIDGIKLDKSAKGYAYTALQRELLNMHRRGIILAIASKNNPDDAKEVFDKHDGMVLETEHFAAFRINWNDKAQSIREIAKELNIGIDSIAFLDDNPAEQMWVQQQIPEVTVIPFPADPYNLVQSVRDSFVFERLSVTDEDRERGRMYVEQRVRTELQAQSATIEDFYRSLEMEIDILPVTSATLARTSQLTQKTNQFNLTTRRYSEQDIQSMSADPSCKVYTLSARDRMGDNGLVGVAITRDNGSETEVDSLLMSCRVIGRTIETAFIAHIAAEARTRGSTAIKGKFIPTKKNAPAKDFYAQNGFQPTAKDGDAVEWKLNLSSGQMPQVPEWIKLRTRQGA